MNDKNAGSRMLRKTNEPLTRRRFISNSVAAGIGLRALTRASTHGDGTDAASASDTHAAAAVLRVQAASPINAFDPDRALGSSIDVLTPPVVNRIFTPEMVARCLSSGWGPITYRNHTELAIQAWHWNPNGIWTGSSSSREEGYFTGSTDLREPIHDSFGYDLPRRGSTRNGGASGGYSRLTDGNPRTFWKSNPYLTRSFTTEDDALHPQWIVIDLLSDQLVNAIQIAWYEPSARRYEVQYWTGSDPMRWEGQYSAGTAGVGDQASGRWNLFTNGSVSDGDGGTVLLRLCDQPVTARWIRIVMSESNERSPLSAPEQPSARVQGTADRRDHMGYAIVEIGIGTIQHDGSFLDLITHSPDGNQTPTYCSSTDPWHRASDINRQADQTGMDLFFTSGITNRLPAVIPVAILFSTPEDAAAQIEYLQKRGYEIGWVEMGEECDGQYCMPEDYAALYLQFAAAIHRAAPGLRLGGPVFQGINQDASVWPDAQGRSSWFGRFLDYLRTHGRMADLAFVSFEHYPFDPCSVRWSDLFREPELMRSCLDAFRQDGLPPNIPLMNTESNLSWELSEYMADIFAGVWLADSVGSFFEAGGAAYFHSPIQPEALRKGCYGWATWGNFVADPNLNVTGYTAQFFVGQMINREWAQHGAGEHKMYTVEGTVRDAGGHKLLTGYALRRPDNEWALMVVNKDPDNSHSVRVEFQLGESVARFTGPVRIVTFGAEQYQWHDRGPRSYAEPDGPAVVTQLQGEANTQFELPRSSVTVLRGRFG